MRFTCPHIIFRGESCRDDLGSEHLTGLLRPAVQRMQVKIPSLSTRGTSHLRLGKPLTWDSVLLTSPMSHLRLGKLLTCTSDLLLTSRVVKGGVGWGWVGCENVLGSRHRDYILTLNSFLHLHTDMPLYQIS